MLGVVCVPVSVEPLLLYKHLITHCKIFGISALELSVGEGSGTASHDLDQEVGLLIDVCHRSLGEDLTPQLRMSSLMHDIEVNTCGPHDGGVWSLQ